MIPARLSLNVIVPVGATWTAHLREGDRHNDTIRGIRTRTSCAHTCRRAHILPERTSGVNQTYVSPDRLQKSGSMLKRSVGSDFCRSRHLRRLMLGCGTKVSFDQRLQLALTCRSLRAKVWLPARSKLIAKIRRARLCEGEIAKGKEDAFDIDADCGPSGATQSRSHRGRSAVAAENNRMPRTPT
jgi:hypothetical protein